MGEYLKSTPEVYLGPYKTSTTEIFCGVFDKD